MTTTNSMKKICYTKMNSKIIKGIVAIDLFAVLRIKHRAYHARQLLYHGVISPAN